MLDSALIIQNFSEKSNLKKQKREDWKNMKLKRVEWIAVAVTAAFLLLVIGVKIGARHRSVPVTVTTAQQTAERELPVRSAAAESELVNLNTAAPEELQTLTGVGPVLAERIVEYREENGPFERIEDVTKVQGIAEKVFSDNAGRMTVD